MKQRYIDYADYNIWANNRFTENLFRQKEDLLEKELVGSFPTIRAIILHIWHAETGWLSRLQGNGWETSKVKTFSGSFPELVGLWQTTSQDFKEFVQNANLEDSISFMHEGETFSIPAREIAQTVFNHGSYHRGQIVMMMRQLGITEIPKTDYIEWVREQIRSKSI